MSILWARLRARLAPHPLGLALARLEARLHRRAAASRSLARLHAAARVPLPVATLVSIALVEVAGRRWE